MRSRIAAASGVAGRLKRLFIKESAEARFIKSDRCREQPFPVQIRLTTREVEIPGEAGLHSGNQLRIRAKIPGVWLGHDTDAPPDQEIVLCLKLFGIADLGEKIARRRPARSDRDAQGGRAIPLDILKFPFLRELALQLKRVEKRQSPKGSVNKS
jgi:hypothetical protein